MKMRKRKTIIGFKTSKVKSWFPLKPWQGTNKSNITQYICFYYDFAFPRFKKL